MNNFLKSRWFTICIILLCIVSLVSLGLQINVIMPLKGLNLQEVIRVGFLGGEMGDEIFYEFPKDCAQDFAETVKHSELKGFPVKYFGEIKGGAPQFVTRIVTNRQKIFDISYQRTQNKTFLLINGIGYECNEQTIDKISEMINQQKNIVYKQN